MVKVYEVDPGLASDIKPEPRHALLSGLKDI
jgi:hypothetical protein